MKKSNLHWSIRLTRSIWYHLFWLSWCLVWFGAYMWEQNIAMSVFYAGFFGFWVYMTGRDFINKRYRITVQMHNLSSEEIDRVFRMIERAENG